MAHKPAADLRARRFPVIIGAAPEYDLPHPFGKRMFADGSVDRKGPPRQENTAATRIKKKKKNPPQIKGKGKEVTRPTTASDVLSLSESDDHQETLPPALEKRILPLRKRQPAKADAQCSTLKDASEVEVQDISSPSGSEFKPEGSGAQRRGASGENEEEETTSEGAPDSDVIIMPISRKRKAPEKLSSRPSKKRVFVDVPCVPTNKDKGKAPARPLKRSRVAASPALSDEVSFCSNSKFCAD